MSAFLIAETEPVLYDVQELYRAINDRQMCRVDCYFEEMSETDSSLIDDMTLTRWVDPDDSGDEDQTYERFKLEGHSSTITWTIETDEDEITMVMDVGGRVTEKIAFELGLAEV